MFINKKIYVFLFLLLLSGASISIELQYQFTFNKDKKNFSVSLEFDASDTVDTELYIPFNVWGVDLEGQLTNIQVLVDSKKVNLNIDTNNNLGTLKHNPNSRIKVSYELNNFCTKENLSKVTSYNMSYISNKDFFINGRYALIIPIFKSDDKLSVIFKWNEHPCPLLSNLGEITKNSLILEGKVVNNIYECFFIGGDFVTYTLRDNLIVVIQGDLPFVKHSVIPKLQQMVDFQDKFFNSISTKEFFLFLERSINNNSLGGNKQNNYQLMFLAKNFNNLQDIINLTAHERLHKWFGGIIKSNSSDYSDQWFIEGFTDYYTYYLNYLSGIITSEDYIKSYNLCLQEYFSLPTQNATNNFISQYFWNGEWFERIPYLRGRIFAAELDYKVREKSFNKLSLDDVIRHIIDTSIKNKTKFTDKLFLQAFKDVVDLDVSKKFNSMIMFGINTIEANNLIVDAVLRYNKSNIKDYGFDFTKSFVEQRVISINKSSSLYHAGVREGDGLHGLYYDSDTTSLDISQSGIHKTISYSPDTVEVGIPFYDITTIPDTPI